MSGKEQESMEDQPAMQKSLKGVEIPVPQRRNLMDAFRKIVQPVKKP
jgi:hypothetical protein